MSEVYASVFAKFENADTRQKWMAEHAINQSVPKGGPVFSFSQEDESTFRDINSELVEALEDLLKPNVLNASGVVELHIRQMKAEKVLAKAKGAA